ncbi:hypothetical protein [Phyllobacterium zundukense]|nr:hypothetical protein [Phyllobacterium zundukense]
MRILRAMITDAVKDYTIIVYSEDVNDPVYWGRDVDKTIAAIKAHNEINVLIRDAGRPDGTVGWVMVLPGLLEHEQIADYSGRWIHEWHVVRGLV